MGPTIDDGGAAVVDLRDFLELGSFLDVCQQGIPSTTSSSSAKLDLGRI